MLLLIPVATAASCPTWNAAFAAEPQPGRSSSTLRYHWSSAPACPGFTLDHYAVCRNDGALGSKPAAPTSPTACAVATTELKAVDRIDRSNHAVAARVFACGDAACTSWYPTTSATIALTATARERWVLPGIAGFSDPDRMVADTAATAGAAMVYPDSFVSNGHLGVWYSTAQSGGQTIRYLHAKTQRWGRWNDNGASFGAPVDVATSAMGAGVLGFATHPWVVPAIDAYGPYIRLYVQGDDDAQTGIGEPFRVWSIDSLDEDGAHYGLVCAGAACAVDAGACSYGKPCDWFDASLDGGVAVEELGADGDAASAFLTSASHGQVLFPSWEDADGAIDFDSEEASILFTGSAEDCALQPDDLYLGTWDGLGWDIEIDSSNCPVVAVEDAHDPSAVPLPGGAYKVYMQIGMSTYEVCHLEDGVVEDCQPVDLAFDDGTPGGAVDAGIATCTDNFGAFAALVSGRERQGATLHAMGTGGSCFATGAGGIVFAELRN